MRIPIPCPDVQSYIEIPENFLPEKPVCLNNPSHKVHWHASWNRELCLDHVNAIQITLYNAYCEECHETISYWPEFVLPYQREVLETHEQVVVEHLEGVSLKSIAGKIGYDPRTISRWLKRILVQSFLFFDQVIPSILQSVGPEILPLLPSSAKETVRLLLAWLHRFAAWISFSRLNRLMGLGNLLGQGNWDLWGAPLGKAKSRVKVPSPPGCPPF